MDKQFAELGFLFILGLTVISAVRCNVLHHKFYKYLGEKHTEKWIELKTILGFGPGTDYDQDIYWDEPLYLE